MSEIFSRRSFLKLSGALVAASALAACSDGGGGGGNGGSGGGGDVPYNPSAYSDSIDGLYMSKPYMTDKVTGQGGSLTYFSLTFGFKNKTGSAITLSSSNFANITFDNAKANFNGVEHPEQTSYPVPVSVVDNDFTAVTVYFSPDSATTASPSHVEFEFLNGNKKAVCKGDTSNLHAWTITVQDK